MRKNLPVSDIEVPVPDDALIVSRTDLKGRITYANRDFVTISGFTLDELIGAPHNLVRHPDMPAEAFADLWSTLKAGRPWNGYVKNRCKDGRYYWVEANAVPIVEGGQITGYLSVRRKAPRAAIAACEDAYRMFRENRQGAQVIHRGKVVSKVRFPQVGVAFQIVLVAGLVAGLGAMAALTDFGRSRALVFAALQVIAAAGGAAWIVTRLHAGLRGAIAHLDSIAGGNYVNKIAVDRDDMVGAVHRAVLAAQTRFGFEYAEAMRRADEATRLKVGLDNVTTGVMVADTDHRILYMNRSLHAMFTNARDDLRAVFPGFDPDKLLGTSMDVFHKNPAHQRGMIDGLSAPHRAKIEVAGRTFSLVAVPVTDANGKRLGTAVEWNDRTAEVAIEEEIGAVIHGAGRGDLSRTIGLGDKEAFFRRLAEGINALIGTTRGSIDELAAVLGALAGGNLERRVEGDYEGVFGQLKNDANATVESLRGVVGRIDGAVEAITTAAGEIAQGNQDLSSRTEAQASSLQETAASMEELTSTVKQNAANATLANKLATDAAGLAASGGEAMHKVAGRMGEIAAASARIEQIISVIDGIAFQTNILALNAAVEAARAGEQGRGFAVVAGEVRTLAQRSAAAAKEIKGLIDESSRTVQGGAEMVASAEARMREMVEAVNRVATLIAEISAASSEQTAGIEQVNIAITQMDGATQQNAALVEQAAAAAESMRDQASQLNRAMSEFELGTRKRQAPARERRAA